MVWSRSAVIRCSFTTIGAQAPGNPSETRPLLEKRSRHGSRTGFNYARHDRRQHAASRRRRSDVATTADHHEYPLHALRSVPRRLPRPAELRPLLRFQRPHLAPRRRSLARAYTIEDLRTIARRRVPRSVFDYVDGAAEQEISLSRARA